LKFVANLRNKLYICTLIQTKIIKVMAYKISEDCAACGTCIDECPVGAISEGDIYKIDPTTCTDCGTCADACPVEAIHPE
jgi:ferredoxin